MKLAIRTIDSIFAACMNAGLDMDEIWAIDKYTFNDLAIRLFHYQAKNNKVYAQFLALIDKKPERVYQIEDIPFLPISFFKTHEVLCEGIDAKVHFESSSTTGQGVSRHFMSSIAHYHRTTEIIFQSHFGDIHDRQFLALLPNYLERKNSSLVSMVEHFIRVSQTVEPTHFLYDHDALERRLSQDIPTVLFGVSFGLLDFVEDRTIKNKNLIIIETGGMKGRKKEITKAEVLNRLRSGFPNATIRSEYGMTELTSQAYTDEQGLYHCPPWMRVLGRLDNDPLTAAVSSSRAGLNIIDLANIHSCAFIATDDLGRIYDDGGFEVLGRIDNTDLRGCSLLVS